MNLTKALKQKVKLVNQANKEYAKFNKYNSYKKEDSPVFDPKEAFEKWIKLTNELIDLKSKIQIANQPIYPKIFRLGELKNMIQKLKILNIREGIENLSQGFGQPTIQVEYVSFIGEFTKQEQIEYWEEEIETLQSEIEEFNAVTQIK